MDKPLISQYVHAGWKAGSMCTNRTLSPGLEPGFSAWESNILPTALRASFRLVEYCFTSHQLIHGYVETDDDEINRNPHINFKDKGSFTSHTTSIDMVWDGHAFHFPVCPRLVGKRAASAQIGCFCRVSNPSCRRESPTRYQLNYRAASILVGLPSPLIVMRTSLFMNIDIFHFLISSLTWCYRSLWQLLSLPDAQ